MSHMRRLDGKLTLHVLVRAIVTSEHYRGMGQSRKHETGQPGSLASPSILNFPGSVRRSPVPCSLSSVPPDKGTFGTFATLTPPPQSPDPRSTTLTFRPSPCTLHRACRGRQSIAAPPCPSHRRSCPGMRREPRSVAQTRGVASPQTCVPWPRACVLFVRWMQGVVGGWIDGMQQPHTSSVQR